MWVPMIVMIPSQIVMLVSSSNDTKSDNDVSSNDSNGLSTDSTNTTKSNNDV